MGVLAVHSVRPAAAFLAPLLIRQGARVRRETPILPEASGLRHGTEGDSAGPALRVVILGESTAAGVGVSTQQEGLARLFAAELATRTDKRIDWRVFAKSGATAKHARYKLLPLACRDSHDLALIVLGVNDTLGMRSRTAWRRTLTAIIQTLQSEQRPNGRVILAGIPDLAAFPSLPQPMRTVLSLQSRALDRQLGLLARPGTAVQHVPAPALDADDFFSEDGFHPNAAAYQQWAAHLAESITRDLNH